LPASLVINFRAEFHQSAKLAVAVGATRCQPYHRSILYQTILTTNIRYMWVGVYTVRKLFTRIYRRITL
jgi:hypothetical protein